MTLSELLKEGQILAEACHSAARGVSVPNLVDVVDRLHAINQQLEADLGRPDYHTCAPRLPGGQVPQRWVAP